VGGCEDVGVRACACAHVVLIFTHATRRHVTYDLSDSKYFFRIFSINGTTFGKKLLNIKCVF
jgi:hypothetical protein